MRTGEEKQINLLIAKGAVHTILGRPFLAVNNVKLEFSHKEGEIFSYPEQYGHQLCLPICNPQAMGWQISPLSGMELCASSEIVKWSVHQAESSKRKETQETESKSSTRVKTIILGPNKIPSSAIFDAKNDLNFITQEIALKAELNISPYTSKSTDSSLKLIGQIKNLEVTSESEGKTYLDFLVFEDFNQIIIEERSSILSSSKESMLAETHVKSKGKETEDKLEVEYIETMVKIKYELKKMRRNLDMAIEDPEKWLALEEETGYISDIYKDLLSEEPNHNIINPLAKRKFEELENESAVITEDKMNQVWDRDIKKGIQQRMEIVPEENG
ncbi:hypothetical protein O181_083558 [Austropuccinia psidii MF-1]|uniref:Uncharacterized protein n=1 Tax=Austropuccinia psidii MF-1 TaxID=1389203 RepID=A0A9Q3FPL4_9BASI|nr:hypothetical protein [Austropuccinia psidii MF-1]